MSLVCIIDVESTGANPEQDRICEIAVIAQDLSTGLERFRYERRINPEMHIAAKASAVHGIMDADVIGCPTFKQIAPVIASLLDKSALVVGHNFEGFDAVMLLHEFIRVGVKVNRFPPIIDTMLSGRWATPDGKMPTLGELCWALGVEYDKSKAHAALYDISVNAQAWREGIRLGVFENPQTTLELHAA